MNGASEAAKLVKKLRKMGLKVTDPGRGKHYIITNPDNDLSCRLPLTPGSNRFYEEVKYKLRRMRVDI